MDKNYYEILEVDKNASTEIIDKAYKTLAKKYHPDLKTGNKKQEYEEKMKIINEAYSVLSEENKRTAYNEEIQKTFVSQEEYQKVIQENAILRNEVEKLTQYYNNNILQQQYTNVMRVNNLQNQYYSQINPKQQYQNTYTQNINNKGVAFRNTGTVRFFIKVVIALFFIMLSIMLIINIPFVKTWFSNLYQDNIFLKAIVDTFVNTFKQIF